MLFETTSRSCENIIEQGDIDFTQVLKEYVYSIFWNYAKKF